MKKYYDVHVFYSRKNGFSVPVEIETDEDFLDEDEVIEIALNRGLIESEDSMQVDYVMELDENEYKNMKGDNVM